MKYEGIRATESKPVCSKHNVEMERYSFTYVCLKCAEELQAGRAEIEKKFGSQNEE